MENWTKSLGTELVEMATAYAGRVVGVLIVFFLAWVAGGWARRAVERAGARGRLDQTLARFFASVARFAILLVAGVACLGVFGVETTSFAAVLGAAGLAIGLAFQGSLSNLAAGVMLLLFRPFKVGDVVRVAGEVGKIDRIDVFVTVMTTADNRQIIVPNSNVFGSTIENVTAHPTRRVDVDVGCDYGADIDQCRKVLETVVSSLEGRIEEPAHQIYLKELGASSIDWQVRVWCKTEDYWAVRERLTRDIKYALDAAGIGIPFPQMDVHLDQAAVAEFAAARTPQAV